MAITRSYKLSDLETCQTRPLGSGAGANYLLASGKRIRVHCEIGWCPACDEFQPIEKLETVDELRRQLEPYRASAEGFRSRDRAPVDRRLQMMIDELTSRIEWRMNRISTPKCLTCGSTRVTKIPLGVPIAHPLWGNRVRVDLGEWGAARFCTEPNYTPEGDAIEEPGRGILPLRSSA